jgi:hypothetical protein
MICVFCERAAPAERFGPACLACLPRDTSYVPRSAGDYTLHVVRASVIQSPRDPAYGEAVGSPLNMVGTFHRGDYWYWRGACRHWTSA